MNTNIPQILRRPLTLTEKGATLKETLNKVMFEVARDASKTQIRAAVEGAFSVNDRPRQDEADGPRLREDPKLVREDPKLEEGDRHAPRGRQDRRLREPGVK